MLSVCLVFHRENMSLCQSTAVKLYQELYTHCLFFLLSLSPFTFHFSCIMFSLLSLPLSSCTLNFFSYTSCHFDFRFLCIYYAFKISSLPSICLPHTTAIQDETKKISQYQQLLDRLPRVNKATLQALINHLYW